MSKGKKATQSQKFIDKAREIGCDENERDFEEKLKRITKAKPSGKKTVAKRR